MLLKTYQGVYRCWNIGTMPRKLFIQGLKVAQWCSETLIEAWFSVTWNTSRPEFPTGHRRTRPGRWVSSVSCVGAKMFRGLFFFQKRNTTREIGFHQCFWLYGKFSLILKGFAWIFIKRGLVQAACSHQKTARWKILEASSRVIGRSPKGRMTGYDRVWLRFWLPVGRYLDGQTHRDILFMKKSFSTYDCSKLNWGVTWPLPVPFTWTMEVGEAQ